MLPGEQPDALPPTGKSYNLRTRKGNGTLKNKFSDISCEFSVPRRRRIASAKTKFDLNGIPERTDN
jgi:hypothetical protein